MWPIGRQSVARHLTWGLHSKSSRTAHCTLLPIGMLSFSRHGALAINAQTFQATIGIFNQIPRVWPSNPKIPRIIHHIWLGSALPKAFQRSLCLYAAWMSECHVDEWMRIHNHFATRISRPMDCTAPNLGVQVQEHSKNIYRNFRNIQLTRGGWSPPKILRLAGCPAVKRIIYSGFSLNSRPYV